VGGYGNSGQIKSAEVYNPTTNKGCSVGDQPVATDDLTLCGNLACGGEQDQRSCRRFNRANKQWERLSVSLRYARENHLCWALPSGEVLLLGGQASSSKTTSERVSADGSSSSTAFVIAQTFDSCGINLGNTYVVTGGQDLRTTVIQYSLTGGRTNLPSLRTGRYGHACSHFLDSNGVANLLVTGGYPRTSTTEIYKPNGAWTPAASLPASRWYFAAATVDNTIYAFGGSTSSYSDDILRYNTTSSSWSVVGKMKVARQFFGLAPIEDIHKICN